MLDINHISTNLEDFLAEIGQVFVVHRGHDSGNTSYGVRVHGQPWFVKYTELPDAVRELEPERERWRASTALHEVATTATRADPRQRYASVAELQSAWRAAAVR